MVSLFYNKYTKEKTECIEIHFFTPIVLEIIKHNISMDNLSKELQKTHLNTQNVDTIINVNKTANLIKINPDGIVEKTEEGIKFYNEYTIFKSEYNERWRLCKDYILYRSEIKFDPTILDEKIFKYLAKPFVKILPTDISQKFLTKISLEEEMQFTILLQNIIKYRKEFFDLWLDIIQGIRLLFTFIISITHQTSSLPKPKLYIDNIFIGKLLHWCSEWQYQSTKTLFDTLKKLDFEIYIYNISISTLIDTVEAYNTYVRNNIIYPNTLYYYMKNSNTDLKNIDHSILANQIQQMGIKIDNSLDRMQVDKTHDSFIDIVNIRKNRQLKTSEFMIYGDYDSMYAEHAYKIIHYFKNSVTSQDQGRTIYGYDKLYITYSSTLAIPFKQNYRKYTVLPLQGVSSFTLGLLIDNSITNHNFLVTSLSESLLIESYSHVGWTETLAEKIKILFDSEEITETDRLTILAKANSVQGRFDLQEITEWENATKIIEELENKEKLRQQLLEKEAEAKKRAERELKNQDNTYKNILKHNKETYVKIKEKNEDKKILEEKLRNPKNNLSQENNKSYNTNKSLFWIATIFLTIELGLIRWIFFKPKWYINYENLIHTLILVVGLNLFSAIYKFRDCNQKIINGFCENINTQIETISLLTIFKS